MSHAAPSSLPRLFTFVGADQGAWTVRSARTWVGDPLLPAPCPHVAEGAAVPSPGAAWALAGITSDERYVDTHAKVALMGAQADLGRAEARRAEVIPIRKSPAWCVHRLERRTPRSRMRGDVCP